MAWAKIDDQFADHPKVIAAGPLAGWLYVCGLTYCARLLTDGFIPTGQVRKLADLDRAMDLAHTLVEVGLWEEVGGGFLVHDYLEYNPARERVLATREVRAQAGSRGGKQRASNLLDVSQPIATDNVEAKSNPVPHPVPVPHPRPDPDRGETTGADAPPPLVSRRPARKASEESRIPDDFPLTSAMRGWAERTVPGLDLDMAHVEFCTYWRGAGGTKRDWLATWQNGMVKAFERQRQRPPPRAGPAGPNGRGSNEENVAEAKRLLREGRGPGPPAGAVVEASYTERRH